MAVSIEASWYSLSYCLSCPFFPDLVLLSFFRLTFLVLLTATQSLLKVLLLVSNFTLREKKRTAGDVNEIASLKKVVFISNWLWSEHVAQFRYTVSSSHDFFRHFHS